jgi:hypothetical protein
LQRRSTLVSRLFLEGIKKRGVPTQDGRFSKGLDEFYFTTAEKKVWKIARCILPNFFND